MKEEKNMNSSNLPSLNDLINDTEMSLKENKLMVLLNQPPPDSWLLSHPTLVGHRYLPIGRVEYMLTRIFTKWWVEVKNTQLLANSVVVTVRVFVINRLTNETEWQDGIGAAPIQTKKGAGAMDWNQAQSSGVQMAAPTAESYAIKDAAEKFGKLFGKDVTRKHQIDYNGLLKKEIDPLINRIDVMIDNAKTVEDLDNIGLDVTIPEALNEKFMARYSELNNEQN
jgi:hypothetical protein